MSASSPEWNRSPKGVTATCCLMCPDVDDLQWREALQAAGGAHNQTKLWPVAANGFQDLVLRKQEQVSIALPSTTRFRATFCAWSALPS